MYGITGVSGPAQLFWLFTRLDRKFDLSSSSLAASLLLAVAYLQNSLHDMDLKSLAGDW